MDVERRRAADWPHWPDRENGHPRRDRLERRLFRDSERSAEFEQARETVRLIQKAAAEKAAQVERLEQAVAAASHVLFAWTPAGYALHERTGEVPVAGARVNVNGHEYAVAKVGRSPFPGDERRCAYLERP